MGSNKFAKHTLILTASSIISQLITALVSLLLVRLYTVEAIGEWSIFLSIVSVISCISTLRYEYAIVIADSDSDAANVAILSLIILLLSCVLVFFVTFSFKKIELFDYNQDYWNLLLFWLPICIIGAGLFQIFNYWCVRKSLFGSIAIRNISNSLLSGLFEVGFGATLIFGQNGIIIGSVLGTVCSGMLFSAMCVLNNRSLFFQSIKLSQIKKDLIRYKNFPIYSTSGALLNQLSTTIATFMLNAFYTKSIVGYYSIAHQIITLPITFIGNAVGQVLYPNAVEAIKKGELPSLIDKLFKSLIKLGFVPLMLIFLCAPYLCAFVYGEGWEVAGDYIRLLTPWILVVFVISPLTVVFDAAGRQKLFWRLNISIFCVRFIALIIGGKNLEIEKTLLLYSLLSSIAFIIVGIAISKIAKYNMTNSLKEIACFVFKHVFKYLLIPGLIVLSPLSGIIKVITCVSFGILFLIFDGKNIYCGLRGI